MSPFKANRSNLVRWIAASPILSLLGLLLSSCGSQTAVNTPAPGTFGAVYANTLSSACIQCHVPGGPPYARTNVKLDFTTQATAYTTLTTYYVTTSSSSFCHSAKIVVAANPANSYLAGVLFNDYNTANFAGISGCQPYTGHLTDQNLSAAEKTSMINWIQAGALNN